MATVLREDVLSIALALALALSMSCAAAHVWSDDPMPADGMCMRVTCSRIGDACGLANGTFYSACEGGASCLGVPLWGKYSDTMSGTCLAKRSSKTYGPCQFSQDCESATDYCPNDGNENWCHRPRSLGERECGFPNTCEVGLGCDFFKNYTCVTPYSVGERCCNDKVCEKGTYCQVGVSKCASGELGDRCMQSSQCRGSNVCLFNKTTWVCMEGPPLGGEWANCSSAAKCQEAYKCDENYCIVPRSKTVGQQCRTNNECEIGSFCSGNVCAWWVFSLDVGQVCNTNSVEELCLIPESAVRCKRGLVCSANNTCTAGTALNVGKPCNSNVECGLGGICACDRFTGSSKCFALAESSDSLWEPIKQVLSTTNVADAMYEAVCLRVSPWMRDCRLGPAPAQVVSVVLSFEEEIQPQDADALASDIASVLRLDISLVTVTISNGEVTVAISGGTLVDAEASAGKLVDMVRRKEATEGSILRKATGAYLRSGSKFLGDPSPAHVAVAFAMASVTALFVAL